MSLSTTDARNRAAIDACAPIGGSDVFTPMDATISATAPDSAPAMRAVVTAFCRTHPVFHIPELQRHVHHACGPVNPASADRVLRALRAVGIVEYAYSRSAACYRVTWVDPLAYPTAPPKHPCSSPTTPPQGEGDRP